MSFTDDELRILKGMCSAGNWPIGGKALLPLLARLEAAEKLIEYAEFYEPVSEEDEKLYDDCFEAWRKAAGK
jgi:hypothetical protein